MLWQYFINLHAGILAMQRSIDPVVGDDDELIPCWLHDETSEDCGQETKWSKTNELVYTNETVVKRLYLLARILQKCFDALGIVYWTSGGTLLGCVRHRGLIPWDDDLDICAYKKDETKIKNSLKNMLLENDYEIIEVPTFGYRVYHRTESESLRSEYQQHRYPFCDIFIMKRKAMISFIAAGSGRSLWPEEYYHNKDLDKMEKRLFGDIHLNCPANANEYLCRTYGENWFDEGATHNYDHVTQQHVNCVKFKLQTKHYEPAQPFI
jgi:lipopolysaccharide cholinephosphotransferase